ncbi:MAG: LytTR family DNA-binding domain-containing protein [Saprospiraceae bacterium]
MRVFIVDDELGAIKNLQIILQSQNLSIEIIGFASNTKDAELKIKLLKPDVVFLDIDMPKETGIQFLKRLNNYDFEVVFVTAYNEFAIQAFKLNAIDYILKPIDLEEIKQCINRLEMNSLLKSNYREKLNKEKIEFLIDSENSNKDSKLAIKSRDKLELIPFSDIVYLKGNGAYTEFIFLNKGLREAVLMSYPISHYESILPKSDFIRIHKSYVLNKNHLAKIERDSGYFLITKIGDRIPLSKRRVNDIISILKY